MGSCTPPGSFLCVFLLFKLSQQATTTYNSEVCPSQGPEPFCQIEGQPDLYGLGTRLGIYFVWLASWIANNYVIEEYDNALDTNAVFLLAIAIAVALNSASSQIRLIDGLILVQMGFGFIFTVMTIWGYRTAVYRNECAKGALRFGGLGTHIRLVLLGGLAAYNIYFWSAGISNGFPECNRREACGGIRVFFFGSRSLYSGARTFYLVVAGVCCAHYFFLCLALLVWSIIAVVDWILKREPVLALERQRMYYECLTYAQLKWLNRILMYINLLSGGWWVLSIEKTLTYNHVVGVGTNRLASAGQLIPLCIGGLGVLKVLIDWRIHTAKKTYKRVPFRRCRNNEGVLKSVFAAWLPWSMVILYDPVDEQRFESEVERCKHRPRRRSQS